MARLHPLCLSSMLALCGVSAGAAPFDSTIRPEHAASAPSFIYAPEYHFDEHLIEFFHPKNEAFKNRYFLENSTFAEAAFFSYRQRYYFFGNVVTNFGMGRQSGAILLDPRDVDMAFGPTFEYRANGKIVHVGLDHHCFHQIDVPEWNTLYWNKVFVAVGSRNMRRGCYWRQLGPSKGTDWQTRLSWQVGYGYFVHEWFGMLDTSALSWGNPYIHEVLLSARWAFFQGRGWNALAQAQSQTRVDRRGAWLWKETLGAEATTARGEFGLSLFVNWNVVDQSIIRENRDQLVEIGARVFR